VTEYLYWVADCKTAACTNSRVIRFGGECVKGKTEEFQIKVPSKITLQCPVCLKSYDYEAAEIIAVVKDNLPPPDFVNLF